MLPTSIPSTVTSIDATQRKLIVGMASLFGGELLDTIGVPGIWFPFGIGVSRTQYVYAIALPLLACLIVRTVLDIPIGSDQALRV
jgi:Ca2+/Na+ antiporter